MGNNINLCSNEVSGETQESSGNSGPSMEEHPDVNEEAESHRRNQMLYSVNESPPWWECIFLGFQHYMTMFWGSLSVPFLITDNMCIGSDNAVKAELVGVMFFVSGIVTILQVLIGVRLPIVQCSTLSLLLPTLAYLQIQKPSCPLIRDNCTFSPANSTCIEKDSREYEDLWHGQIQVIQGSIMVGSVVEILLGMTGSISLLMRYIGPLSICPTISLLGLSLFKASADYGAENWPVCILTLVLLVAFSQYLGFVRIPLPAYSRDRGLYVCNYPLFEMFPVILAVFLAWLICYIFTVTNIFHNNTSHWSYGGRTDANAQFLVDTPWFSFFYPGKYGVPRVDVALVLGLLAGFMASIFESLGDYYACARMAGVPSPPKHAINRGIAVEGFGCLLAGAFGTGNGMTSASPNICVIGLTKIASRTVVIHTAVIMMGFAVINKFGALFVTIPNPIIGASYMVLFGMIIAIGIANLQFVDLNSSRNLFVIGFSFFMGLTISEWIQSHSHVINTGWAPFDSMITVLLGTSMFVGGLVGFILDNTIPGTPKERGMFRFNSCNVSTETMKEVKRIYELPSFGTITNKFWWTKYLPFCPPPEPDTRRHSRSLNDPQIKSQLESLELGLNKNEAQ